MEDINFTITRVGDKRKVQASSNSVQSNSSTGSSSSLFVKNVDKLPDEETSNKAKGEGSSYRSCFHNETESNSNKCSIKKNTLSNRTEQETNNDINLPTTSFTDLKSKRGIGRGIVKEIANQSKYNLKTVPTDIYKKEFSPSSEQDVKEQFVSNSVIRKMGRGHLIKRICNENDLINTPSTISVIDTCSPDRDKQNKRGSGRGYLYKSVDNFNSDKVLREPLNCDNVEEITVEANNAPINSSPLQTKTNAFGSSQRCVGRGLFKKRLKYKHGERSNSPEEPNLFSSTIIEDKMSKDKDAGELTNLNFSQEDLSFKDQFNNDAVCKNIINDEEGCNFNRDKSMVLRECQSCEPSKELIIEGNNASENISSSSETTFRLKRSIGRGLFRINSNHKFEIKLNDPSNSHEELNFASSTINEDSNEVELSKYEDAEEFPHLNPSQEDMDSNDNFNNEGDCENKINNEVSPLGRVDKQCVETVRTTESSCDYPSNSDILRDHDKSLTECEVQTETDCEIETKSAVIEQHNLFSSTTVVEDSDLNEISNYEDAKESLTNVSQEEITSSHQYFSSIQSENKNCTTDSPCPVFGKGLLLEKVKNFNLDTKLKTFADFNLIKKYDVSSFPKGEDKVSTEEIAKKSLDLDFVESTSNLNDKDENFINKTKDELSSSFKNVEKAEKSARKFLDLDCVESISNLNKDSENFINKTADELSSSSNNDDIIGQPFKCKGFLNNMYRKLVHGDKSSDSEENCIKLDSDSTEIETQTCQLDVKTSTNDRDHSIESKAESSKIELHPSTKDNESINIISELQCSANKQCEQLSPEENVIIENVSEGKSLSLIPDVKLINESSSSVTSECGEEEVPLINNYDGNSSTSELNELIRDTEGSQEADIKNVLSVDYHFDELIQKLHLSGNITSGEAKLTLYSKTNKLHFHKLIMRNLELRRITELTLCQMITIPLVSNEHNLVLIGPPRTKKTSGWLLPMLDNLLNDQSDRENSPKCIIIAPGSNRVRYLARLCSAYVGAKLNTISTYGGGLELERKNELLGGVDILISTPRCCLRLFQAKYVIKPDQIRYFVIDSGHEVLKKFSHEIKLFQNGLDYEMKIRKAFSENSRLQVILTSTEWNKEIDSFSLNWLNNPIICMMSHLDSAIYSLIKHTLHMITSKDKINTIFQMIAARSRVRTIVVCYNANEAVQLHTKLCTLPGRTVLIAHENMHHLFVSSFRDSWCAAENVILICTDSVQFEINVQNANWLIHCSLPGSKSDFRDRYKFIKYYFVDRVKNKSAVSPNCTVDIFVDENSESYLPNVVDILERLDVHISDDFRNKEKEVKKLKEMEKNELFCENILQFGLCSKAKCKMRHVILPSKDVSQLDLEIQRFVSLQIMDVISPTHLIARIKSCSKVLFSPDETVLPSNLMYITLKLADLFNDTQNRSLHGRPCLGDVVGVIYNDEHFVRGKIIEILERDDKNNAMEVSLYLIDKGTYLIEKVLNLYALPVDLQTLPGEAINIYITGLLPLDLDSCWSYTACKTIKEKLMRFENDKTHNYITVGQVQLIIGRSLILDKLLLYEEPFENSSPWLIDSLQPLVISSNFGIYNNKHKDVLNELAKDLNVSISKVLDEVEDIPKNYLKMKEEVRWAHLRKDENDICVLVSIIENADLFFVRLPKFQSSLHYLQVDLKTTLQNTANKLEEFNIGTICAVKLNEPHEKYMRGLIVEPTNPKSLDSTEVEVFLVDYGEAIITNKFNLLQLPQGFISRLPFQAIECELAGVQPFSDENFEEAVKEFNNLTAKDNCLSVVYLQVYGTPNQGIVTNGNRYQVILYDTELEDEDILINMELVNRGFTTWKDNMQEEICKNIRKHEIADVSESSEEEYNDDIEDKESILPKAIKHCGFDMTVSEEDLERYEVVGNFDYLIKAFFPCGLPPIKEDKLNAPAVEIKEIIDSKEELDKSIVGESAIKDDSNISDVNETDYNVCKLNSLAINTPTVHWHQSCSYVWIKILLPDVVKFKLSWTMMYINFQTLNNNKIYWVDIDLFGPINPDSVRHKISGLYFEIKLTKLTGHLWPRICYHRQKLKNIIHDPDKIALEDDGVNNEAGYISSYVARAKENYRKQENDSDSSGDISGDSDIDDFRPEIDVNNDAGMED